jgi:integrase/recombinase XerD
MPDILPKAIDPDDIKLFLSVINSVRNRALILVLLRTGMRIGELLGTKIIDIDFSERKIKIPQAHKNHEGRIVYMGDDACSALKNWLKERLPGKEYIFYGKGNREQLSYPMSRALFVKYMQRAGLSHKGYTLHCLRHTFASELLNAGMRLECLQVLLGHKDIEMTRRYARLTDVTRKHEYFKAMEIIEKGEIDGHYRFLN